MNFDKLKLPEEIELSFSEGILHITINREQKMNALNRAMVHGLLRIVELVTSNEKITGAIITGKGQKSFISGGDIREFASLPEHELLDLIEKGQQLTSGIENCPKPFLAAINGFAFGGGCEIAMACHIRMASSAASFGLPEVKLGMLPGYGGTQRITILVGRPKALEIMITGRSISAEEALQLGLINHLIPHERLMEETLALMHQILSNSPVAVSGIIRAVNACEYEKDGFLVERTEFGKCLSSKDFTEGTQAFIDKRKPHFR